MLSFFSKSRRREDSELSSDSEASLVDDFSPERTRETASSDLYDDPDLVPEAGQIDEQRHSKIANTSRSSLEPGTGPHLPKPHSFEHSTKKHATRTDGSQPRSGASSAWTSGPKQDADVRMPSALNNRRSPASSSHTHTLPNVGSIDTTGSWDSEATASGDESSPLSGIHPAPSPPGVTQDTSIHARTPPATPQTHGSASNDHGTTPQLYNSAFSGSATTLQTIDSVDSVGKLAIPDDGSSSWTGSFSTPISPGPVRGLPDDGRTQLRLGNQDDTTDSVQSQTTSSHGQSNSSYPPSKSTSSSINTELQDEVVRLRSEVQRLEKQATEEQTRFDEELRAHVEAITNLKEQEAKLRKDAEKLVAEGLARFDEAQRAHVEAIASLKEQEAKLRQDTEKSAAEELARFNAVLSAKDGTIARLEERTKALRQTTDKSAAEELIRLNAALRAKDDIIAELKRHEAKLRQVRPSTQDDLCLDGDVKGLVEALNYEILLVATAAAQYLGENVYGTGEAVSNEDKLGAIERVKMVVGERFCRELGTWNHREDFTLLQLALQAILCQSCKHSIELWDDGVFEGLSDHLTQIYQTMRSIETQSVFAQWRALTQRHVDNLVAQERSESKFTASLLSGIVQTAMASNVQHSDLGALMRPILSEKLSNIALRMHRLKTAITLDFVSGDFELVLVPPGKTFEDAHMRNIFDSDDKSGRPKVACTTELGLKLTKRVSKGEELVGESADFLLTQVLLESSLDEFLQ